MNANISRNENNREVFVNKQYNYLPEKASAQFYSSGYSNNFFFNNMAVIHPQSGINITRSY